MYGLVNNALKDVTIKLHGEPGWQSVRSRSGIEMDEFENMQQYDDEVTLQLVLAFSEEHATPVEKVLEDFGFHWISFAQNHPIHRFLKCSLNLRFN